jgi:predicted ATPase
MSINLTKMKLKSITLAGYKSIGAEETSIDFGDITILLGANGVGKSNLISFFNMLNAITRQALQVHIAEQGYADSFLHFGAKKTNEITAAFIFEEGDIVANYSFTLSHAVGDTLIFAQQYFSYQQEGQPSHTLEIPSTVKETDFFGKYIRIISDMLGQIVDTAFGLLSHCKTYHFQDTAMNARVRGQGYVQDNQYLNSDASNLAAFLFRLKENADTEPYYRKIVRYIQLAMPQFGDFDLRPNEHNKKYIALNWRDRTDNSYLFGPHQISDGSLRFMCLATLLLQAPSLLPKVIILDEPELGLHPSAINYLSGMIKTASQYAQIVIATQSPRLVDEFELNNIVTVERDNITHSTVFTRKNESDLSEWLNEYSLSELWEKNVIGGQP